MIKFWSYEREFKKYHKSIIKNVKKTLSKGSIFFSNEINSFEKEFTKKYKAKYGIAVGSVIEVVEYGPWKSGLDWVIAFLVDDGDVHDKHLEHLFNSNFKHCGVGLNNHNTYGNLLLALLWQCR